METLIYIILSYLLGNAHCQRPLEPQSSWLVFTRNVLINNTIRTIIIQDLNNPEQNESTIRVQGHPQALSYDFEQGKVYWSIRGSGSTVPTGIQRANLDGSNVETLVTKIEGDSVQITAEP